MVLEFCFLLLCFYDFLSISSLDGIVGPDVLYDYFSHAMQSDSDVGGTYRQWLETQSALSKVGDSKEEERALKIACLLNLGLTGERFRTKRELLEFALQGLDEGADKSKVVEKLIKNKPWNMKTGQPKVLNHLRL